jgi:GxxExxY protein
MITRMAEQPKPKKQKAVVRNENLLFPELSYAIIGCAFDVYNELGSGHHEKFYQRALAKSFQDKNLSHKQQIGFPLTYHGEVIGERILDFLVEDTIIVEIKKGSIYSKKNIDQVLEYLALTELKLAILISFGQTNVSFKRIVNFGPSTNRKPETLQ